MESFFTFLNGQHSAINFTNEEESNNCLSFLDVLITRNDDNKLTTSIHRKPFFSGLYLKFDSFVPHSFKRGLVNCLVNRAWHICSNFDLFHSELDYLRTVLASSGYPTNFVDSCIRRFLDKKYTNEELPMFGPKRKTSFYIFTILWRK